MSRLQINPNLSELVTRVRPLLTQYLIDHGVQTDGGPGKFRCLNPEHPDNTASMHLMPTGLKVKCFGCSAAYDVMDLHSILEKRPKAGVGWLHQNLYELARRYNIEFQEVEPTEQELLLMRLMRMYQDAADLLVEIASKEPDVGFVETRRRGISDEVCIEMGVGMAPWKSFLAKMKACGHDPEMMKEYDLDDEMFGKDKVTFTLKDKHGTVVGFARRWLLWDKGQEKLAREKGSYYPPKFSNTSAKVPFFQKEAILYGLDTARKESYRRLETYEGYFDVLAARQHAVKASVCALGTSLTEFQVMQALDCGFTHINWVGDMDPPGLKAAMKALEMMSGREGLKATVTFLEFPETVSEKDRDPDTFFQMYGADAYFKLPEFSGFEWKLDIGLKQPGQDLHRLALSMISLIMNERDHVTRGKLAKHLANRTGVPEEDIRAELRRLEDARVDNLAIDLERGLKRAKDSRERVAVIQDIASQVREVDDVAVDVSVGESARAAVMAFSRYETPIVGLRGWKTGWDRFDKDFDGFPKEQELIAIAGPPSCGKSAMLTNLAVNLTLYNPDQVSVIYHIMDDPRDVAIAKVMSCLTGLPIRMVRRAATDILPYPHLRVAYDYAKGWLLDRMHSGYIVVKGQEMGSGTDVATRLIDNTLQKVGKPTVYMADSLHSITDEGGAENERSKFTQIVRWAQNMSDLRRITMLFTCELTKEAMKHRPSLHMTAETRAIGYSFKAVGLVWNALNILRDAAMEFWLDKLIDPTTSQEMGSPVKRPIMEVAWEKNKITGYTAKHHLRLWDQSARVAEMTFDDVEEERRKASLAKFTEANVSVLGGFQAALPNAPGALVQAGVKV